jgi:hypothetical protein
LLHQLVVLAQSQPVFLVHEDVHWIDPMGDSFPLGRGLQGRTRGKQVQEL